ncbi:unnamed protein product, partial [marine sediment metagenome]
TRLGKDGKVYRISESQVLFEEKVEVIPESEWDQCVRKANELGKAAIKIHRQMYFTDKDVVLPMLRRAHRLAMSKYAEQIVALAHISPDYIRRFRVACLKRRQFLKHKWSMMQKVRKEQMFEQLQKTLIQYEIICEQVQALSTGMGAREGREA